MCCRSNVSVYDPDALKFVMEHGLFVPTYSQPETGEVTTWERKIPEEGGAVIVTVSEGHVSLAMSPSISVYHQHQHKRITAGVLFEIAARYAQHVGGEVIQRGLVQGCRPSGASGDVEIAFYPVRPLTFDTICQGFRAVLLGETDETLLLDDDDEERRLIPW